MSHEPHDATSPSLIERLDQALSFGTTGRDALPNLLKDCKDALEASRSEIEKPQEVLIIDDGHIGGAFGALLVEAEASRSATAGFAEAVTASVMSAGPAERLAASAPLVTGDLATQRALHDGHGDKPQGPMKDEGTAALVAKMRLQAGAVYLACELDVAHDIANSLKIAADLLSARSARGENMVHAAWRYRNKKTGVETLTHQPPDRVLFPDDFEVVELFAKPPEYVPPSEKSEPNEKIWGTGWLLGNNYKVRGRLIETAKGSEGEPWYEAEDGTKWSSFDVRFRPDVPDDDIPQR